MSKQVIWSPLAEEDFANILEYLYRILGSQVALRFMDMTDNFIQQIAINSGQFPLIHKKQRVRKCVITKHNSLFYREAKEKINILRIYDTRQDPNQLKFE